MYLSLATRFDLNQLVVTLEAENKCQVHVYVLKHSRTLCISVFGSFLVLVTLIFALHCNANLCFTHCDLVYLLSHIHAPLSACGGNEDNTGVMC